MVEELIHNWAPARVAREMQVVRDNGSILRNDDYLLFIATLWSGRSQMAFRTLCKILEGSNSRFGKILIADSEDETLTNLKQFQTFHNLGNGVVISFVDGKQTQIANGNDLKTFADVIRDWIAACSQDK
jgi:hypothetical protein